ncbi:hypothetical protein [endosymbiont of Riftia pachyptila]|nr:hypothetical protein [endosymbiont of Riftia pachyptila]
MKGSTLMILILSLPLPATASHTWSGIDLCEVHKDKLPPGLTVESLPDSQSPEASLLQRFCTQCHNLPGPDRHTAAEWREVASKMFLLMDVSHRFGGLMGRVETMQKQEQERLLAYLQHHAMQSIDQEAPADIHRLNHPWLTRIWVLGPFLLLTGLGLLRWWRDRHTDKNHA